MIVNGTQLNVDALEALQILQLDLQVEGIEYLSIVCDSGNNVMCQCPFHGNGQERRPSFGVKKDTGIGHCFACGAVVDFPGLVSYVFGYNDFGAYGWSWLRRKFLSIDMDNPPEINFEEKQDEEPEFVSEEELDKYRYTHPYWAKRGIVDESIIELFDLGYDRKSQCITFPVRDIHGRTLFVARRSVNTKYFNYPRGSKKSLYGLYELYDKTYMEFRGEKSAVFVTESMIDCILLWQAGYYAVALNGLGDKQQFEQLNSLQCRTLILATDNDKAGLGARDKIKRSVHGKIIKEVHFPNGIKDIGECTDDELRHIEDWITFGPKKITR